MKFSRNPVSGQVEIYTDDGVYLGIVSTMGDSFMQDGMTAEDGGPGSGNFGHKGRPGKVGGSGKGGGKQYRGGRSDIGYYSSRKDWLNGLSGEKQHEAVRYIAEVKRDLNAKRDAKEKIESLFKRGYLTSSEAEERLKEAKLDGITDDMTPEEYLMKNGNAQETYYLLNLAKQARSWDETKDRLIDENLSDEEQAFYRALEEKWDDMDKIYTGETWKALLTKEQLEAKAMGLVDFDIDMPDEIQYRLGTKERPEPPKPEGPDYSWYEGYSKSFNGSNMEYYMGVAAGERHGYAEKWDQPKFEKLHQNFVDRLKYGKMSPNEVSYYGTIATAALRSNAMGGQTAWNYGDKVPQEMADRLSEEEKAQMVNLMNALDHDSFISKHDRFEDLTMKDFRDVEAQIKNSTPRSNEAQKPIRDYLLLQNKMTTGCVPKTEEERAKEAENAKAEQAQQAQQAEQTRIASMNSPEVQKEKAHAAELRKERESGKSGAVPGSVFAQTVGDTIYNGCTAAMDKCESVDAQVAWDIYHADIRTNNTSGGSFYRPSSGEITLNHNKVPSGDSVHEPFETAFHEVGHAIDHAAGRKFGYGDKHLTEVWRNGLFCDTIEKEAKAFIDKIGDEGKKQFELLKDNPDERRKFLNTFYDIGSGDMWQIQVGRKIPKWTVKTKRKYIAGWLNAQNSKTAGGLCDTIQGASRSMIVSNIGHKAYYYKGNEARGNMATEVFANLYGSLTTNRGNYETMKKYFPETVNLFHIMLGEIAERG